MSTRTTRPAALADSLVDTSRLNQMTSFGASS